MLELIVGPFPLLERRLAESLAGCSPRPGVPLPATAVVTPSGTLVRHLSEALVRDHGLALANVRFHSFQSMARSMLAGAGYPPARFAEGDAVDRRLLEKALDKTGGPLAPLAATPGLLGTLGKTVLELEEAKLVTSGLGSDALEKAGEGSEQLAALVPLMEAVAAGRAAAELLNRADMVAAATVAVETGGAPVAGFDRIFHYGAYDLTQNQLDFLLALARILPVTVLFPALTTGKGRLHRAYDFAETTLTLVGQKAGRTEWLEGVPPSAIGEAWPGIMGDAPASAPGKGVAGSARPGIEFRVAEDEDAEFRMVAEECWRLIEEHGYSPDQITVVTRSPSLSRASAAFQSARLPWFSSWEEPVSTTEPGRAFLSLFRVLAGDFGPAAVAGVLGSRWLSVGPRRLPAGTVSSLAAAMWHGASPADWELLAAGRTDGELAEARAVAAGVRMLAAAAGVFPARAGWNAFVDSALDALDRFSAGDAVRSSPLPAAVLEAMEGAMSRLRVLARTEPDVPAETFWRTALAAVERAGVRPGADGEGVRLCDAMEGRGISSRAVFMAGLNESVFPRILLEDPFLRDPARRFLNDTLGMKIQMKGTAGLEEERLLFHLWLGSAREKLYLSHRRSDEKGVRLLPSGFLEETVFAAAAGAVLDGIARTPPFPSPGTFPVSREAADRGARAREFQARLEGPAGGAGGLDGIMGTRVPRGAGKRVRAPALSVSEMVQMAKCPFGAFMQGVLEARARRVPDSPWEVMATEVGMVVHTVLDATVGELKGRWGTVEPGEAVSEAGRRLEGELGKRAPALARFAVLEEVLREGLERDISEMLRRDLDMTRARGLKPVRLEKTERGDVGFGGITIGISARIDRVDEGNGLRRVVDYKSHLSRSAVSEKAAFDGNFFQLALYAEILGLADEGLIMSIVHMGRSIGGPVFAESEGKDAADLRGRFRGLAGELARMAAAGTWFPCPAGESGKPFKWRPYCQFCEYALLCRGNHEPTVGRLKASPAWERFEGVFRDTPKEEAGG